MRLHSRPFNGMYQPLSMQDFFAILNNRMEERVLKNTLGSIEQEQKRLLRRFRSETRLLKIKQGQRLGTNLSIKRQDPKGVHVKGTPSPPSPKGKAWCTYDKRQSSKSIFVHETALPESDSTSCSADEECTKVVKRLARLSSMDNVKAQDPMSPTSKDTCQSPVSQKDVTTPDRKSRLAREQHKANGIVRSIHTSEGSACFLSDVPKRNSSPRIKSKTWNGKMLPTLHSLSDPVPPQMRCFSEEDIERQKGENVSANDLKTASKMPNRISKMVFPTAEDIQCRNFLSLPNVPIRKSSSINYLTDSVDSLAPVSKDQAAAVNSEADLNEEKAGTYQLPISSKETIIGWQNPVCLLQRRLRPLSKQSYVLEDTSSTTAASTPCKNPIESPRVNESGTGAVRKVPVKRQTCWIGNDNERGQEATVLKNASVKKEKLTARSNSLSSKLGHCHKEDISKMENTKKSDSLRSKGSDETLEDNLGETFDKSKWLKAVKKVFNVNMFLNGIAALQKQRGLDHLAEEQKQAALEKLYEEIKYCRYLRLPSNEDDMKQQDAIAWVFDKE